ncbi:MAG: hypothetical protein AAFY88_22085, partial [Acidobacteriota bacterium]
MELQQVHRGIPVEGARAVFRIVSGRIVQFGTENLAPVRRPAEPALSWMEARRRAARAQGSDLGALGLDALGPEAELVFVPAAAEDTSPDGRNRRDSS